MLKEGVWWKLLSLDLRECDYQKLIDKNLLKNYLLELCKVINMKPYWDVQIKKFWEWKLEGYSWFQFIETSSIVVHLDEFWLRAFIDIFSCKDFDENDAIKFSLNVFWPKDHSFYILDRY